MNSLEEEDHIDHAAAKHDNSNGSNAMAHHHHHHLHQNLYKTVELKTSYSHEVVIKNTDPKSVLTWDFDVLRSDLHFTLYRVTQDLPEKQGKRQEKIIFLKLILKKRF